VSSVVAGCSCCEWLDDASLVVLLVRKGWWYARIGVGFDVRQLGEGGPLRNTWLLWIACGVFAVVVVLSVSGRDPEVGSEPLRSHESPRFRGEEILGTRGADQLQGTPSGDLLFSFGGPDRVTGGDGSDLIDTGNGEDVATAGPGDDRVRAYDGHRDAIDCGDGFDVAYVDALDTTVACEEVVEWADYSLPATPSPP